ILARPAPPQLVKGPEHANIDSKCRESTKQECIVPACEKRLSKGTRSPHCRMPVMPVFRNIFQMWISREDGRRRLCPPPFDAVDHQLLMTGKPSALSPTTAR